MALPTFVQGFGIHSWLLRDISLDKRRFPLTCSSTAAGEEKLTMNISPVWGAIATLPEPSSFDDAGFEWKRTISFKGNLLACNTRNAVNAMEFSPEQYAKIKDAHKNIRNDVCRILIFDCKAPREENVPEPDVFILDSRSEFELKSRTHYTKTNTVKIGINTYNGLKDYSELRIPFCPDFTNVRLEYAKVTIGDKTSELNLSEIPSVTTASIFRHCQHPRV